jgi:hypothetical protein
MAALVGALKAEPTIEYLIPATAAVEFKESLTLMGRKDSGQPFENTTLLNETTNYTHVFVVPSDLEKNPLALAELEGTAIRIAEIEIVTTKDEQKGGEVRTLRRKELRSYPRDFNKSWIPEVIVSSK